MAKYVAIYGDDAGRVCDSAREAVESLIEDYGIEPDWYEDILIAEILPMGVSKTRRFQYRGNIVEK